MGKIHKIKIHNTLANVYILQKSDCKKKEQSGDKFLINIALRLWRLRLKFSHVCPHISSTKPFLCFTK